MGQTLLLVLMHGILGVAFAASRLVRADFAYVKVAERLHIGFARRIVCNAAGATTHFAWGVGPITCEAGVEETPNQIYLQGQEFCSSPLMKAGTFRWTEVIMA